MAKPLSVKSRIIRDGLRLHPNLTPKQLADKLNTDQPGYNFAAIEISQQKQLVKKAPSTTPADEGLFAPASTPPVSTPPVQPVAPQVAPAPVAPAPAPTTPPAPAPVVQAPPVPAPVVQPPASTSAFVDQLRTLCQILGKDAVHRLIDSL